MVCRGWGGQGQEHTAGQQGMNLSGLCLKNGSQQLKTGASFTSLCIVVPTSFETCWVVCWPRPILQHLKRLLGIITLTDTVKHNNILALLSLLLLPRIFLQYSHLISAFEVLASTLSLGQSLGSWSMIYRTQEYMFERRAVFSLFCGEAVCGDCYIFPTVKILIWRH